MVDTTNIKQVLKKQTRMGIIIGILFLLGSIAIYYFTTGSSNQNKDVNNKKIVYVNTLDQIDTQSIVLERTQKKLHDAETKTQKLEQKMDELLTGKQENKTGDTDNLKNRLNELENKLQALSDEKNIEQERNNLSAVRPPNLVSDGGVGEGTLREDKLSLTVDEAITKLPLKNPDTYVPSGTFVKAVIIGGADASASVTTQDNPKVMLLRIIEEGRLPNHKKSHLKGCMAVGKVTGDISSERGSVKIERLSCVFPNNEVVDQQVVAIVFGPDGKVDVRGNVREGGQQYVGRAFVAGTLSGLSEGLSQAYTVNSISPEGNVETVKAGNVFKYGGAKGASKGMNKLADYQIRKAEQFHPVIQLTAGTVVDIVFQMGFFLDGKNHEERDIKTVGTYSSDMSTNTPTLFPAPPPETQNLQALPLSQKAIDRIEKYNKELGLRVERNAERRENPYE